MNKAPISRLQKYPRKVLEEEWLKRISGCSSHNALARQLGISVGQLLFEMAQMEREAVLREKRAEISHEISEAVKSCLLTRDQIVEAVSQLSESHRSHLGQTIEKKINGKSVAAELD